MTLQDAVRIANAMDLHQIHMTVQAHASMMIQYAQEIQSGVRNQAVMNTTAQTMELIIDASQMEADMHTYKNVKVRIADQQMLVTTKHQTQN